MKNPKAINNFRPSGKEPEYSFPSPLAQQFLDSQHRIESKLDELLYLLKGAPHLNEQTFKDAIRESLRGNRKPLEDYLSKGGKVPEITA